MGVIDLIRREPTVYLLIPKLILENLHECVSEISPRCVDRLRGRVQHRSDDQGTTHDAPRLVNDDKLSFSIVMDDFHRFSGNWGFVSVYDIPGPEVQHHETFEVKMPTLCGHRYGLWYRAWQSPR